MYLAWQRWCKILGVIFFDVDSSLFIRLIAKNFTIVLLRLNNLNYVNNPVYSHNYAKENCNTRQHFSPSRISEGIMNALVKKYLNVERTSFTKRYLRSTCCAFSYPWVGQSLLREARAKVLEYHGYKLTDPRKALLSITNVQAVWSKVIEYILSGYIALPTKQDNWIQQAEHVQGYDQMHKV